MASEDVIELGSSEDEAEPAPKKKKPMPNAMVHIPTKLPGLTIKPAKFSVNPTPKMSNNPPKGFNVPKGILAKPIMISKSNLSFNPNIMRHKPKPTPLRIPVNKNFPKIARSVTPDQNRFSINPLSIAKNLNKPQLVVRKLPTNKRLKNPVEIQGPRLLNNLPPGITIKPLSHVGVSGFNQKQHISAIKNTIGDLLNVEVDEEEAIHSSICSPQWYLRPEEQEDNENFVKDDAVDINKCIDRNEVTLEEQNNKEPETQNFVEITIEDSPVKALHCKDRSEIGQELAITIEDSPIKPIKLKCKNVDSDGELSVDKVPQSKKKLDYPRAKDSSKSREVVEIEIDLMETAGFNYNENEPINNTNAQSNQSNQNSTKLQKTTDEESGISKMETNVINETKNNIDNDEFHPVYQKFIDMCFKLENSEDMKKIVEKKIKAYYKQCPKEYVESDEFIDMVSSKIVSMKAGPEKMYLYIKDIVDELNLQRKMTKTVAPKTAGTAQESDKFMYGDESEYDSKRQKQIRKLEKTIKKLHRAIQKLEEQEVDFDDDEDSVYLLTERYKERMVRVHAKFCQLTNTKMPSEPRIYLDARPGRPPGPVRKLEKWINKKVPIGNPLPFPDFHDVVACVREANIEDKLGWNEVEIMEEARDLFTRCGKKLQRRRQENEWRLAVSRISHDVDPAEKNVDLKKKLDENKSMSFKREIELLNKYVDRQNQLKLVAEEIGDKEAEESPVESEEEEFADDDNSLENKQKRKERLKRLIQEKHRKSEEEENNHAKEEDSNIEECSVKKVESRQEKSETKSPDDESNRKDITASHGPEIPERAHASKNLKENIILDETKEPACKSDENEFESDIDELHLLQKLHSENESGASTHESSDSDTTIAISDTLESDSEAETKNCDVISIENSSYSESETVDGLSKAKEVQYVNSKVEDFVNAAYEVEYCMPNPVRTEKENIIENILLASSDEETSNNVPDYGNICINLKDDDICISETTVDRENTEKEYAYKNKSMVDNNNSVTFQESLVENENSNVLDCEKEDEQDNNSINSVLECSDVDDTSCGPLVEEATIRSTLHVDSIMSIHMQTEQNEDKINSNDSSIIIKTSNTERNDFYEENKSQTQHGLQAKDATANIET